MREYKWFILQGTKNVLHFRLVRDKNACMKQASYSKNDKEI